VREDRARGVTRFLPLAAAFILMSTRNMGRLAAAHDTRNESGLAGVKAEPVTPAAFSALDLSCDAAASAHSVMVNRSMVAP
jgi:hypothetical protein